MSRKPDALALGFALLGLALCTLALLSTGGCLDPGQALRQSMGSHGTVQEHPGEPVHGALGAVNTPRSPRRAR